MTSPNSNNEPPFMGKQRKIVVPTTKGNIQVPASNLIEGIPDLAVTMTSFTRFEVTHVPSGLRLVGNFERAVNALIAMAEMQLAFNELGINTSLSHDELKKEIASKDRKCGALGMKICEWVGLHQTVASFSGEFPWEGGDDCPHNKLENLMAQIEG